MGELGAVRRYHYWSNRRIHQIAEDNDISLNTQWPWSLRTPTIPFVGQIEIGESKRDLRRNEVASRLETAVGLHAVADLITPPPVRFAKGIGHIEFARFFRTYALNEGAVMHTRVWNSQGSRADICLFGSMDNFSGYIQRADYNKAGWTSSAWHAIEELLSTRGKENTSQWDDEESRAVEALKIALGQGLTGHITIHKDRPWTRGFTLGCAEDSEWFAEIYVDVLLDRNRWDFHVDDPEYGAERILIGAPLWIRTALTRPVTLYHVGDRSHKAGESHQTD
jgi:hypothetical protein